MTFLLNQIIQTSLKHGWYYHYRINIAHLENHCNNGFSGLKCYLNRVFEMCPNEKFESGPRSSKLKIPISVKMTEDSNNALCRDTAIALETMTKYKTAHSKVQMYMLKTDKNAVSIETPIWIDAYEYPRFTDFFGDEIALSGHIDLLRVYHDRIQILDYKPKACKEKYASTQTYFYALMLSMRTGIPLDRFECGYFDDKTSYFFNPSEVMLS